ncbi:hypothetical protein [Hwanghaeella sp.]|uniref:hypothetical protein n=1 Tax=Hwanghaeella sp. TaxID=2605943 RepID=UPI003CCC1031
MSLDFLDSWVAWVNAATGVEFSLHGWLAFILGAIGVLVLNVGLMLLVIRSNRQGHDEVADEVGRTTGHHKVVGD